ncbi:MAG TPA: squalene synthase HpnC [Dongiaceae bacterium]
MATQVETPSGKNAAGENFPVGSWLLPARLRPHVAVFYAFARAIDDIADNADLQAEQKIARLDGFAGALAGQHRDPGYEKAVRLRASLLETNVTTQHGLDLIAAFKQDAIKLRYRDWDDLMGYCILSASPVGRYLLDLHGESRSGYAASDALCNALQVLNHLQDCQDDYRQLDRVYLPQDWLAGARATVEDLDKPSASAGIRRVIDLCLDGSDELIVLARQLPGQLRSRHLAMESAVIVRIADRLSRLLRRRDPLAMRVKLSKPAFLACGFQGALSGLFRARPAAPSAGAATANAPPRQ